MREEEQKETWINNLSVTRLVVNSSFYRCPRSLSCTCTPYVCVLLFAEAFVESVQGVLLALRRRLAIARDWSAKARDALCSASDVIDPEILRALVQEARDLPLKLDLEVEAMLGAAARIEAWRDRAKGLLSGTATLHALASLQEEAHALPFLKQQPEFQLLTEKADTAVALLRRAREVVPSKKRNHASHHSSSSSEGEKKHAASVIYALEADILGSGLELREAGPLLDLAKKVRDWQSDATSALAQTPDLKQLQSLLATGESLPVTLGKELGALREKLAAAEAWVERVRSAVPLKKTRKNADVEKADFGQMKSLLQEVSGMQVEVRERDQMAAVVETAEDWIERVREAMNSGEESTLSALEELLAEADSIPVTMSEHQVLLCEIRARRWATRVREMLGSDKDNKLEALEKLLVEFEAIREALPLDPRAKKSYKMDEEVKLRGVVAAADTWKAKVKRATAAKKGTPLHRYSSLLEEAAKIPVNLEQHTKPIVLVMTKAEEWRKQHAALLRLCAPRAKKATSDGDNNMAVDEKGEGGDGGDGSANGSHSAAPDAADADGTATSSTSAEANAADDEGASPEPLPKVSMSALESCLTGAEKVHAAMEEVDELRSLLEAGKAWLEQTEKLCPKRAKKTSTSANGSSGSQGGVSQKKPTVAEMHAHIEAAAQLPFDLAAPLARLSDCVEHGRAWQQQAQSILQELAEAHEAVGSPKSSSSSGSADSLPQESGSTDLEFPPVDEDLLEGLKAVQREAEVIAVFTEEEALVERYFCVYNWCHEVMSLLGKKQGRPTVTLNDLERIAQSGKELFHGQQRSPSPCNSDDASNSTSKLPVPAFLKPVLSFGERHLTTALSQYDLAAAWCKAAKKCLDGGLTFKLAKELLEKLSLFRVSVTEVSALGREVRSVFDWLNKTESALAGEPKRDLAVLVELVESGEKLKVDQQGVKKLKQVIKVAKAWRAKVKKTGIERGEATTVQLRELLPEADSIMCNLSAELRIIHLAVSRYCVCRKPSPDHLQTCSSCSEKYHASCIDLSNAPSCPRCAVQAVYQDQVQRLAEVARKWPAPQSSPPPGGGEEPQPQLDEAEVHAGAWIRLVAESLASPTLPPPTTPARPLPPLLERLVLHAAAQGIQTIPDVQTMLVCVESMSWCFLALEHLWGPPKLDSLRALVARGTALNLAPPALAPLQDLAARGEAWQTSAVAAISVPPPGNFNMALLGRLRDAKELLPIKVVEERQISAMLEDRGARYCTCRGPADGSFMIGCDTCDMWFHGKCVGVTSKAGDAMEAAGDRYSCPLCCAKGGIPYVAPQAQNGAGADQDDEDEEDEDDADAADDLAMKAAWLSTLWPPGRVLPAQVPPGAPEATDATASSEPAATSSSSSSTATEELTKRPREWESESIGDSAHERENSADVELEGGEDMRSECADTTKRAKSSPPP